MKRPMPCHWQEDENGNWETECGEMHILIEGTPEENSYRYCPYCQGSLTSRRWAVELDPFHPELEDPFDYED